MDKNIAIKGIIKEMNEKTYNLIIDAGKDAYINCSFDSTQFTQYKSAFVLGKEANNKGIYYGCDGFEKTDDLMELMPVEKSALLKTCCINKK
jgi:folate-dependent tRNA-U54 methylase TrmFO/GidA